jgi:hypothetical protein
MSYGIMWPLVNNRAGDWFPAKNVQGTFNPTGLTGYKVHCAATKHHLSKVKLLIQDTPLRCYVSF